MTIKKYNVIEVKGNDNSEDYSLYFPHTRNYVYNDKPCDTFRVNNCLLSTSLLVNLRDKDRNYPMMYVNNHDIRDYVFPDITIDPDVDSYSVTVKLKNKIDFLIFEFVNLGKIYHELVEFKDKELEVTPIFEEQ